MISNYQIVQEEINRSIIKSGLDIGAAYFVLKDILNEYEKAYYAQIAKEMSAKASSNKAEGEPPADTK